jgi:hypothetical protein
VWDAETAKQLAVLTGHGAEIWSAAWSPDARRIVTASFDHTARLWDADTATQLALLSGHRDGVWSAAWSPDGRRIVTTSADQTVRIWDATAPVDLEAQIAWSQAAKIEDLSDLERTRLGLPRDTRIRTWPENAAGCDTAAAAPYDPDRRVRGVAQANVSASAAADACAQEITQSGASPRLSYQWAARCLRRMTGRCASRVRAGRLERLSCRPGRPGEPAERRVRRNARTCPRSVPLRESLARRRGDCGL